MAIDVKNIQLWAQRVVECSVAYVRKYPLCVGVLLFLFLLYIFLRSLFIFIVFTIPIFIFICVAFRFIFIIHQENLRTAKGDNYNPSRKLTPSRGGKNLDKRGNLYAHAQSVRRRSSKKYENHVHFQDEKDTIFSTEDNSFSVDKEALVEETPKDIQEVGDGSGLRPNRYNVERLGLEGENSDEREYEDEEEASEDGNKAVEWTEDDQKNLMDLGFSEMERNKRLESLIAKRKARKLLSLQVRKTLMNIGRGEPSSEINSFSIPKIGAFPRTKSAEALISPTPGSAPSILLPVHNPFDIPYDPQEEKPNLTGGFQEELVENHYNDAVFCRHESFSLGSNSQGPWELPESSNHSNISIRTRAREIPEFSRFKEKSGKDNLTEPNTNGLQGPTQECEVFDKSIDVNTKKNEGDSKLDTEDIHESSSSSSTEIKAPFSSVSRDDILKSLSFSVRKNVPVTQLDTNVRRDDFLYHENQSPYDYKGMYVHTPSMSIASDLQVEVSEVGSQITNLSSDEDSPKYDFEGNSGNDEIWVASPQLQRVEANEAKSGEVREVSEQDIMQVGFSRINQENGEPIALENAQLSNENNMENSKEPSNSVENVSKDERNINDMSDQVELVHDDQGIIDFIQHTYGEDPKSMNNQGISQESKPENNNSNSVISLGGKQSEPEQVPEGLNLKENNSAQVSDISAENGSTKASSSTSPRYTAKDEDTSKTGANDPEIIIPSKKGQNKKAENAAILVRPLKRVMLRGLKPKPLLKGEIEQAVSSPSSTQKKFYLMANLSFDDIYEECQQSEMETEQNSNSIEDSKSDQTQARDSLGLQELSFPQSLSIGEDNMRYNTNDRTIDELVQTSDNGADIGMQTNTKENEINVTIKGVGEIELKRCEEVEDNAKLDNTKPVVITQCSCTQPENNNLISVENLKGVEEIGELKRSVEVEDNAKLDNTKPVVMTQGSCTQPENNNLNSVEYLKGVEVIGELKRSEEFEDNAKLHNSIENDDTKPIVMIQGSCKQPENNYLNSVEYLKGVEEIGKLKRSEDVEVNANLDNSIENANLGNSIENNDTKLVDINQGSCTQPENNKLNSVNYLEGETQSEPKHAAEQLLYMGDNSSSVKENVAENISWEARSATSPRSATGEKEPSILLEKPTEVLSSLNGVNDPNITISSEEDKNERLGTAVSIGSLEIEPKPIPIIPKLAFDQVSVVSSPSSTPNSMLRKKFYLMANMSFDHIHEECQESDMEIENNGNSIKDSKADQTEAGDSVGLKESQTPMDESEETETVKGNKEIRKLETSEDVEGLSKLDNTIDSSKSVGVIESYHGNLAESEANNDPDIRVAPEKNE